MTSIALSFSLLSPLFPISKEVITDQDGNYGVDIFCFLENYTGPVELTIKDDVAERTYSGHTNELGSVSFHVTGKLPDGETKKSFPILISAPNDQQESFLNVTAA